MTARADLRALPDYDVTIPDPPAGSGAPSRLSAGAGRGSIPVCSPRTGPGGRGTRRRASTRPTIVPVVVFAVTLILLRRWWT